MTQISPNDYGTVTVGPRQHVEYKISTFEHQKHKNDAFYIGNILGGFKNGVGALVKPNATTYIGEFVGGLQDGVGMLKTVKIHQTSDSKKETIIDDFSYLGEFKEALRHGIGRMITPKGEYIGVFINNMPTGFGLYYDKRRGIRYYGGLKNTALEGFSVLESSTAPMSHLIDQNHPEAKNSKNYFGGMLHGLKHGLGMSRISPTIEFVGNYKEGARYGRGVLIDSKTLKDVDFSISADWRGHQKTGFCIIENINDQSFIGDFKNDQKSGIGKMVNFRTKTNYLGEWARGMIEGFGRLQDAHFVYIGSFEGGEKSGLGYYRNKDFVGSNQGSMSKMSASRSAGLTQTRSNVSNLQMWPIFFGEWKSGKKHGYGIEITEEGVTKVIGSWKNGLRHGVFLEDLNLGKKVCLSYNKGKLVEEISLAEAAELMSQGLALGSFLQESEQKLADMERYIDHEHTRTKNNFDFKAIKNDLLERKKLLDQRLSQIMIHYHGLRFAESKIIEIVKKFAWEFLMPIDRLGGDIPPLGWLEEIDLGLHELHGRLDGPEKFLLDEILDTVSDFKNGVVGGLHCRFDNLVDRNDLKDRIFENPTFKSFFQKLNSSLFLGLNHPYLDVDGRLGLSGGFAPQPYDDKSLKKFLGALPRFGVHDHPELFERALTRISCSIVSKEVFESVQFLFRPSKLCRKPLETSCVFTRVEAVPEVLNGSRDGGNPMENSLGEIFIDFDEYSHRGNIFSPRRMPGGRKGSVSSTQSPINVGADGKPADAKSSSKSGVLYMEPRYSEKTPKRDRNGVDGDGSGRKNAKNGSNAKKKKKRSKQNSYGKYKILAFLTF